VLGPSLVLLASSFTWAKGTAELAGGELAVTVGGRAVTPAPAGLAAVAFAALIVVFTVRGFGRALIAGLLALCGAAVAYTAAVGASDREALDARAAEVSGDAASTVHSLSHTAWPWAAAAGGLLILLAGLLALRYGSRWPAMSARYERDGTPRPRRAAPAPDPDRPEDLWKALDRGEDPTGRT
jgi:uncharacterized membrane protein (TIGR02234 family)